ncbi:MAG: deoxynucleoside kinase [Prevotellaceae bacterium]|jgi:deoxyadenosine/deoxycytidine kinase|nr:deoxynucleoside kinase [Prevotellaceae bacterium]
MHIAIAGNIGSGKTTLAGLLSKHYGWEVQFEDVDGNPYLTDFYEDMQRWSFNLQIFFLNKRLRNIIEIGKNKSSVIQDRTIYEDACIFAPNLYGMGLMAPRDYENYRSLYDTMIGLVSPPDLLIYLRASVPTLVNQIQKRGREYEEGIRIDYLNKLNKRYEDWIETYENKRLTIDVDSVNFSEKQEDLRSVISKIDAQIYGLFT